MATFNWQAHGNSPMASRPLTWIFDAEPIWYRWAIVPHGVLGMMAIGNPLLWWASIAAVVGLFWAAWRQRDVRLAVIPLLVCVLYLPWLATSRVSYIYYLTPAIPFLAIAVAAALARLAGPVALRGRWAALAFAAGALLMGFAAGGTPPVRLAALAVAVVVMTTVMIVARRRAAASPRAAAARLAATAEGAEAARQPEPAAEEAPARPMAVAAWLYTGAVAGLAVAWLPFLVSYVAPFAYYARLAWFTTWR
jgi:dolichyl-phosphate-mannose--protein O-mannosyl transferase